MENASNVINAHSKLYKLFPQISHHNRCHPPNKKNGALAGLSLCLNFLKNPSKPVKFGGILYVLVDTDYAAAHLLQRH
jgi:hypothetical protein